MNGIQEMDLKDLQGINKRILKKFEDIPDGAMSTWRFIPEMGKSLHFEYFEGDILGEAKNRVFPRITANTGERAK